MAPLARFALGAAGDGALLGRRSGAKRCSSTSGRGGRVFRLGHVRGRSAPKEREPSIRHFKGADARPNTSDDGRVAAISGAVTQTEHTTAPPAPAEEMSERSR